MNCIPLEQLNRRTIISSGTVNLRLQLKWKWGLQTHLNTIRNYSWGNEQNDSGFWKTATREMEEKNESDFLPLDVNNRFQEV